MKQLSAADLDLVEQLILAKARVNFWAYRRYMNPRMKVGWWQEVTARILQRFYEKMVAGERPKEIIQAPPQHGKSETVNDFISWIAGQNPDLKQIFASFSDRLGVRANLRLQRTFDSEKYQKLFPATSIAPAGSSLVTAQRNRELLEFVGRSGSFRNTTVRGSITGEGLDFGIIDDPIKGRQEANSPAVRDSSWEWLTDDFFTRFSEYAGLLAILTRWHVDDPMGRLILSDPTVKVHSFPAIAVKDERFRRKGEALFPEHKSIDFLRERQTILAETSWESLYQQNPYILSGGMFPIAKLNYCDIHPHSNYIAASCRYWDKAGTKDGDGARTAGVLMHRMNDGQYVVEDVVFGRWAALEREEMIKATSQRDGIRVQVKVEQEPGSGGKESAENPVRNLAGAIVSADRPVGDKTLRAEPFAAQVQGGNVWLVRASWNSEYTTELKQFPNGTTKDMVDASSGAFSTVSLGDYDMEALV